MDGEQINIIDNLVQAISILNKTEEYLNSIDNRQSEFDVLLSAFYHFIEMTPIEKVNLDALYSLMQEHLLNRRKLKYEMALQKKYENNIAKLNNSTNREFFIAELKKVDSKNLSFNEYGNADKEKLLPQNILEKILKEAKKGRGRPRKVKEGV